MKDSAAETLPAAFYRDPRLYETERQRVFARSWLLIAHESQFAGAGAYVATTVAGYPLLLVRGEDATIRAFHNVCRHRAGPLAEDGTGDCQGALVCRYHGWRYAFDGRLANARDFGPAEGFDPRDYALFGIACETWRGFVFVNLDRDAPSLAKAVAPIAERTRDMKLESLRLARRTTHEIRCNWKTYVENYLEGYHIPNVHPGLAAALDAGRYETEIREPAILYFAPPRDGAPVSGLYVWLWPCLGINFYTNGLMMERMWPMGPAQTRLDYLYFFAEGTPEAEIERAVTSSEATTVEDAWITEHVQRNLDAGVYAAGRLSPKHEQGVRWFQQELRRAIRADGSTSAP